MTIALFHAITINEPYNGFDGTDPSLWTIYERSRDVQVVNESIRTTW